VNYTSRMYVFETTLVGSKQDERDEGGVETDQNLVEKVLDELLFEWPRCKETMKISAKELSDEISGTRV
jgi:hypothetical protein